MSDRPILMSDALVRGLLAGRKTQTRRLVSPQPPEEMTIETAEFRPTVIDRHGEEGPGPLMFGALGAHGEDWGVRCPFGKPGDRLWVRECWGVGTRPDPVHGWRDGLEYRADGEDGGLWPVTLPDGVDLDRYESKGWRPSIHMPRWASRLTLDVTGVRVERAQAISDADVAAEGIDAEAVRNLWHGATRERRLRAGCHATRWPGEDVRVADDQHQRYEVVTMASRRNLWRAAWILLHGEESWRANPWCWVIEFKRAGGAT